MIFLTFPLTFWIWALAIIPGSWRLAIGRVLGSLIRLVSPRIAVIDSNLEIAFPGDGKGSVLKRARLRDETYVHLANLIIETLFLLGPMKWFTKSRVSVDGFSHLVRAMDKGKGAIFLASHMGNWEIMAARGGLQMGNLLMVTKKLKPKWFHKWVEWGRNRCGVNGTYEPKTLRDILAQIKKGGLVGIVLDQYAGPPIGIRVPFFGLPVGTHSVVATLVKRTGAAVVPVFCRRLDDGSHQIEVGPEIPWTEDSNASREIALNTAHYSSIIESEILRTPEQWLWMHRRFKGDLSPLKPTEWERFRLRRGLSD
ncbi:MAG: lysophospholipid acyltransferase family protein [Xanthomonadaceae bacterium]|nr:lysophospholipid acyltransferase family protein [Xanthomonadaceae bacterium]